MGSFRLPLVIAAATAGMDCGPSPKQVGEEVLLVAPLVFVLSVAAQWLLLRLWRRRFPEIVPPWPTLAAIATGLIVPATLALGLGDRAREWLVAVWLFGCSYATVLLMSTRLVLWLDRRHAFTVPHVTPLLIFVAPAAALALGVEGPLARHAEDLYTLPGLGGWVAGGLFLALLAEAALRTRRPVP